MRLLQVVLALCASLPAVSGQRPVGLHQVPLADPDAPVLVSTAFDGAEVGEVVRALAAAGGYAVKVDSAVEGLFTGSFRGEPLDLAIDRVLTARDLELWRVNRRLWLRPRTLADGEGRMVSVVTADASLVEVVAEIARQAEVPIVVAPGSDGVITCELDGVPWSTALDLILTEVGLELVVDGQVFLIRPPPSPDEDGSRFSGELISLWLDEADVKDLLRTFSELTGINMVVHPSVSCSITLELRDVHWDQALDVILSQCGLVTRREGGVLMVYRLGAAGL